MKFIKYRFLYNKSQRNGILVLMIFIIIFQAILYFDVFSSNKIVNLSSNKGAALRKQIDSLKIVELTQRKPNFFPFNPNYITDFKGAKLGMSLEEIDRLLAYRKAGKFINSKKEFKEVTKISDSLLEKIAVNFKFPEWINKRKKQHKNKKNPSTYKKEKYSSKYVATTNDINKATANDFKSIYGVGDKLSERIIKYRNRLQGFYFEDQINEIWGLDNTAVTRILATFKIKEKPQIKKQNINTITFKELLKNPYIDYNLCKKIFNYRDEVAELQSINELKKIKGFPLDKFTRIILYLEAK